MASLFAVLVSNFAAALAVALGIGFDWVGEGRFHTMPVPLGPCAPEMSQSARSVLIAEGPSEAGQMMLTKWAERSLTDWQMDGKCTVPRVMLAKLARGEDIEEVNRYLRSVKPWSESGSTWPAHEGDYDFSEVTLTALLYLFGDRPDRLYPETVEHLLDKLLVEEGGVPRPWVPLSFGLVLDTENHHLMTESSRYLKNQWLHLRGTPSQRANPAYNNRTNGLEEWLTKYLALMRDEGVYEFNSVPYIGYTIQALLNLDAFAGSDAIGNTARYILDIMNWQYALGSLDFRRCAPFRRRTEHAGRTALSEDNHVQYMLVWASRAAPAKMDEQLYDVGNSGYLAELLPYRLPSAVHDWVLEKPLEYFIRIGRGRGSSPEIYSGASDFLISAGGAHRGWRSSIVARPTSLLLRDGVTDLRACFHIRGHGGYTQWNNTGVYKRFACGNSPVSVPQQYTAAASTVDGWAVYTPECAPDLLIMVYNSDALGLIALFPGENRSPEELLTAVTGANPSHITLAHAFTWPDGGQTLTYDVNARKGTWVMESVNDQPLPRYYDQWPQFDGECPAISFDRR